MYCIDNALEQNTDEPAQMEQDAEVKCKVTEKMKQVELRHCLLSGVSGVCHPLLFDDRSQTSLEHVIEAWLTHVCTTLMDFKLHQCPPQNSTPPVLLFLFI